MIEQIIKQLNIPGRLIYLSQYGSHLYGLNIENSDLDFRGVYIPTLDDIILKKDKDEINEELVIEITPSKEFVSGGFTQLDNGYTMSNPCDVIYKPGFSEKKKVDVKIFSLQKFIQLCSKADTNALDLLFSVEANLPYFHNKVEQWYDGCTEENEYLINYILRNRGKLINTDRLESPITYAFKQATKYGLKGERLKVLQEVLERTKAYITNSYILERDLQVRDIISSIEFMFDNKHLKIDELDNKGKLEKYLFVCGVQHQFNLDLSTFCGRLLEKINKEYTSQRTIDAADGNDWKALSHAIRVLLEVKELLDTGNIQFPLKDKDFLLEIKLGKVGREYIDNYFNTELSNILERVQNNELGWKYDEEFWNEFILSEVKPKKVVVTQYN